MAREYEKCILHSVEYRNTSTVGNPSYWVYFTDSEGNFQRGYTGSNSSSGYVISNYRNLSGSVIYMKYHFTRKTGACIIDCIKHNTPEEAAREAEAAEKQKNSEFEEQIEKLEEQIEKMKCCENCRYYSRTYGHCYSYDSYQNCKSLSNWSLADC